jgi:uncharacterized protein YydD (DUF2326 family)
MITLKKFYIDGDLSDGKSFTPIKFEQGLNIILGDRSPENADSNQKEKMNSVGKSLLIEMINYCLMKDPKRSRVKKIPEDTLPRSCYLCLELECETDKAIKKILVRRSLHENNPITIAVNDEVAEFEYRDFDKAAEYLGRYFIAPTLSERPSLRRMLSILIRDEKTGFDNILYPNAASRSSNYATLISPHVYLFGLSLEVIKQINEINKLIEKSRSVSADMQKRITVEGVKLSDVRLFINDLDREVKKLDVATRAMRPSEGSLKVLDELNKLNSDLEGLVAKKAAKESLARKIKSMPVQQHKIKPSELAAVYNKYKDGLGTLVAQTFEETLTFRNQIAEFENELMTDKITALNEEIHNLSREIEALDDKISKIYVGIGYADKVTDFRVALKEQTGSQEKLSRLKQYYKVYEEKESEKKRLSNERDALISAIEKKVESFKQELEGFENDLIEIHEAIYDNAQCQFKIEINQKAPKQYLTFNYRADLDGGASSDRIKIFMYDVLLMLNNYTAQRHPLFLIHDNVFSAVGKNDMVTSLNYLNSMFEKGYRFQYIVAINRDEFEAQEQLLNFDTEEKKRVVLTRNSQLLHRKYAQIGN